jgi:hypothetical protein
LYSYKYADLTEIISATRPALTKYGLSFTQSYKDGGFLTVLFHSSGESMKTGFVPCEIAKNLDMKVVAGLFTYGKRISLTAALGVSADEDIDAAAEESKQGNSTTRTENKKKEEPSRPKEASTERIKELFAYGKFNGYEAEDMKKLLVEQYKIETTRGLTVEQCDNLAKIIKERPLTKPLATEEIPSPHKDSNKETTSASQDQKQKNSDSTSQKSITTEQTESKPLSKELKDTIIDTGSETWSYLNGSSFKEVPKEDLSRLHKWIVKEVGKTPAPKGVGSLVGLKRNIEKFLGGFK